MLEPSFGQEIFAVALPADTPNVEHPELTLEEGPQIFDRAARRRFGMSGEEFLHRWDAGEFRENPDDSLDLMHVLMLLPLVR